MTPPLPLRIGIVGQLLLLLVAIGFLLPSVSGSQPWTAWASIVAQAAILPGIWGMRRWAVVAYAVIALASLVAMLRSVSVTSAPAFAAAFLVTRGLILAPAVFYWKRMR